MMIFIGYTLFLAVFFVFVLIAPAKSFLVSSFELAPEITVLVGGFYLYIVVLTIVLTLFKKNDPSRASFYTSHVKMACSVMVSLGLVGTFLGLVDMIAGIAGALSNDDPDFSKKMQVLLSAISGSLSAMSFAFVTSILGVGVSSYSLVAATFVTSHFKRAVVSGTIGSSTNIEDRITKLESFSNNFKVNELEVAFKEGALLGVLEKLLDEKDKEASSISRIVEHLETLDQSMEKLNKTMLSNKTVLEAILDKNTQSETHLKEQDFKMDKCNSLIKEMLNKTDDNVKNTDDIRKSVLSVREEHKITADNLSSLLNIAVEMKSSIKKYKDNMLTLLK